MIRFSFICIFNNYEQLNRMLLPSLAKIAATPIGGKDNNNSFFNYLLIDNRNNRYKSAAEAYNSEIKKNIDYIGDVIIFVHQDIAFDNLLFLKSLENKFSKGESGIFGYAGIASDGLVYSNLQYYYTKEYIIPSQANYTSYKKVISVDECCFALKKELFVKIWFDEKVCFHWHLYAVDLCYQANLLFGVPTYVSPDILYHKERGSGGLTTDVYYFRTLWRISNKYRKDLRRIYSTCCVTKTNHISLLLTITKYLLASWLNKI